MDYSARGSFSKAPNPYAKRQLPPNPMDFLEVLSCPSAEGGENEEVKQEAPVNWGHMEIKPKQEK